MRYLSRIAITTLRLISVIALMWLPVQLQAAKYPLDYRWMTWTAGDVSVYYPEGYGEYARYIAGRAFVHLDSLEGWYGVRPPHTKIVLHPAHDRGMAFASVMPTRMEISLTPVLDKGLRPQGGHYLDRVTAHELTHIVQFNTVAGISRPARWIFGDAVAPLGIAPDWIVEGQAIWTESRQGGGRLNSPYHRLLFRSPLLEGNLWTLDQIAHPGTVKPLANRAYVAGSFLVGDIIEEFRGIERTAEWMRNQARYVGFHRYSFKRSFSGRTAQEEYTDLRYAWRDDLRELMIRRGTIGYAVGHRVLAADRTSFRNPAWVNDSTVVVWEVSYDHPARLVFVEGDPLLSTNTSIEVGASSDQVVTPYGDGFIVSRIRRGKWAPEETRSILVRLDRKGREHHLGGSEFSGWSPAWNETTGKLAYLFRNQEGGLELRTIALDEASNISSEAKTLFASRLGVIADPAWSVDGKRIAFTVDMGDGERILVMDIEDESIVEVRIEGETHAWDPAFSPSGNLWVSSAVEGVYDLFEVDLDARSALRRTRCLTGAMEPSISPDGKRIAYSHYTSEGFSLALLDSTRWALRPIGVTHSPFQRDTLLASEAELDQPPFFGRAKPYQVLEHVAPVLWLPAYEKDEEDAYGATILGRDPLGLLSWRLRALVGARSEQLGLDFTATWRGWPLDITGRIEHKPDELRLYTPPSPGSPDSNAYQLHQKWRHRLERSLLFHQSFRHDSGPWLTTLTPFGGWVTRERFFVIRDLGSIIIEPVQYQGLRGGVDWFRVYGAARDPVARHLLRFTLSGERDIPGVGELKGRLFESSLLYHTPFFFENVVLALGADGQVQHGQVHFSHSLVLPRGYSESDLPIALKQTGRIAKATASLRFPLWFTDRGLGMGWAFLRRIDGTLFMDAATGWGGNLPFEEAIEREVLSSYGAEIRFGGWMLYEAALEFRAGFAFRRAMDDGVFYLGTSLPTIPTGLFDTSRRE